MTGSFPSADYPRRPIHNSHILTDNPFLVTPFWDRTRHNML
jgi:hypothetical protein